MQRTAVVAISAASDTIFQPIGANTTGNIRSPIRRTPVKISTNRLSRIRGLIVGEIDNHDGFVAALQREPRMEQGASTATDEFSGGVIGEGMQAFKMPPHGSLLVLQREQATAF
jgi:hypothetical protein